MHPRRQSPPKRSNIVGSHSGQGVCSKVLAKFFLQDLTIDAFTVDKELIQGSTPGDGGSRGVFSLAFPDWLSGLSTTVVVPLPVPFSLSAGASIPMSHVR